MTYVTNNIFARILRGEIPCNKVYEDDHVLAFHDIHPLRKVHVLVLSKGSYKTSLDFSENATDAEIIALWRALPKVVDALNLRDDGYRIINNCGKHGDPHVPHVHFHILGGEPVGPVVSS